MHKRDRRPLHCCAAALLLMTIIFLALYGIFLFGGYLYAYQPEDIGSDTVMAYLPRFIYSIRNVLGGWKGGYTLQWGLGAFCTAPLYEFLNPLQWPILLFGEGQIGLGIICSVYCKTALTCLFAWLFLRRVFRTDKIAVIGALLWSANSYIFIWCHHYSFLTSFAALTMTLYFFQLYLEGEKGRVLLIPSLAVLASSGYVSTYIGCVFFAVYGILYLAFRGSPWRVILKKAGIFAAELIVAVGIAAPYLVPALADVLDSTRTPVSSAAGRSMSMWLYSGRYLMAFLARLLSGNLLGVGNAYVGPTTYNEVACLSVTALFLFAMVWLLQGKDRKRTAVIAAALMAALAMPITSQVLNFSAVNQRWDYLLCIAEIFAVVLALREIFAEVRTADGQKRLFRTVLVTDAVYMILLAILWAAQRPLELDVRLKPAVLLAVFAALYSGFFLTLGKWKRKGGYAFLLLLVSAELIVCNWDTLHDRMLVTTDEWNHALYYDATEEAADWIAAQDGGIYRINKTYDSAGYNDALVQGYRGMAVYSSTNTKELSNYYSSMGYVLRQGDLPPNWIRFSAGDDIVNTLLGVKYLIAQPGDAVNEDYYREIYSDESHVIYENRYALGFGYLYSDQISKAEFDAANDEQRRMLLTEAYYLTDEAAEDDPGAPIEVPGTDVLEIQTEWVDAVNCTVAVTDAGLQVEGTGDDMQLFFDWPEIPEGWSVSALTVTGQAEEDSYCQVFVATEDGAYREDQSVLESYEAGTFSCRVDVTQYGTPVQLRVDPSAAAQTLTIDSIQLHLVNDALAGENLRELQQSCMTDLAQEGNTFTGTVSNPNADGAMLCIPLICSSHWTATVDGEAAEVVNINGGLVGIALESGAHEISITYHDNTQAVGRAVGAVSLLVYLAGVLVWRRMEKRRAGNARGKTANEAEPGLPERTSPEDGEAHGRA